MHSLKSYCPNTRMLLFLALGMDGELTALICLLMRTTSFWKAAYHEGTVVTNLMKLLYSVVRLLTKVLICGDHSQQSSNLVLLGAWVCNSCRY